MLQTCHRACISAKAEAGSGLGHELRNTRPADILASNWLCGKPAAFDLTVVSPLNPTFISEAGRIAGSAAVAAELRKHSANDAKCSELGWTCIHSPCGRVIWSLHGAVKRCKLFHGSHHTLPQGPTPPSPRL